MNQSDNGPAGTGGKPATVAPRWQSQIEGIIAIIHAKIMKTISKARIGSTQLSPFAVNVPKVWPELSQGIEWHNSTDGLGAYLIAKESLELCPKISKWPLEYQRVLMETIKGALGWRGFRRLRSPEGILFLKLLDYLARSSFPKPRQPEGGGAAAGRATGPGRSGTRLPLGGYPGQKVICINDRFHPGICEWGDQFPVRGRIYTVKNVKDCKDAVTNLIGPGLLLEELNNPGDRLRFSDWRFRPCDETET